ncbi:hypothetical protein [Sphingomonas sp. 3-13AW]|uniref:hypothetical protein n=1 Tax=Sphingomonas sp. 3-13AW TaxID=3050450 RepID=UPI003BB5FEDE
MRGDQTAAMDRARIMDRLIETIHKSQGVTVDRAHVLATPGMDRNGAVCCVVPAPRRVALHYGRDNFVDQRSSPARSLSRDRAKDMASDYPAPSKQG